MYRIDNSTAISSIPTPAAIGPNPNGFFTDGNPSTGVSATIVDQDWANAVQEEIALTIEGAGITLDKTKRNQLLTAIKTLAQQDSSTFTTSTSAANTYTATLTPAPAAYTEGMIAFVLFTHANTGAATINLNGLGAESILNVGEVALSPGDIANNGVSLLIYDGTAFQLLNPNVTGLKNAIQNASFSYVNDSGTANVYAATLAPVVPSYVAGLTLSIKIANTNTSTSATLNVSGLGAKSIKLVDGSNPYLGAMIAGGVSEFNYDGTNFQLLNPVASVAAQNNIFTYAGDTGSANAYVCTLVPAISSYVAGLLIKLNVANTNTGASTINVSGLGTKNITTSVGNPLIGGEMVTTGIAYLHYDGTKFQLLNPANVVRRIIPRQFTFSTTYTPTTGMLYIKLRGIGGGGASGSAAISGGPLVVASPGGGAGGYSEGLWSAAQVGNSLTLTIGAAGTGGGSGGATTVANTGLGTFMQMNGGGAGASTANNSFGIPGNGGSASGGNLMNKSGMAGFPSYSVTTTGFSGAGASSEFGAGGAAIGNIANSVGNSASGFGAGAGGALIGGTGSLSSAGGNGSPGYIEITEFCN